MTDSLPSEPGPSHSHEPAEAAPSRAGFPVLLFLVPGGFAAVVVLVWWTVGWLLQQRTDPRRLVRELLPPHTATWQQAHALAELLRNPRYRELKRDPEIARGLAALLEAQLDTASMAPASIRLRVFLCRVLGEFELGDVLPALIRAAREERQVEERDVRRAALEAMAVLASRCDAAQLQSHEALRETVLAATAAAAPESAAPDELATLRATATFTLGALGGDWATARLEQLLSDPAPNVRFNAATGLARHGVPVAVTVLTEMLDPQNPSAVDGETTVEGRQWKRALIITNALRAARELAARNPAANLEPLRQAVERLDCADVSIAIRDAARETLPALTSGRADQGRL